MAPPQNGKTTVKCPKIQRLVTPQTLQRKRRRAALKKERIVRKKSEAAEYHKLLVQVGTLDLDRPPAVCPPPPPPPPASCNHTPFGRGGLLAAAAQLAAPLPASLLRR